MTPKITTPAQLTEFVAEVKKLNEARTHKGYWKYMVMPGDDYATDENGACETLYEVMDVESEQPICNSQSFYPQKVTPENQGFIAKSPQMAEALIWASAEIGRLREALDKCEERAISGMAACVEGQRPFVQCSDISDIAAQALNHNGVMD